VSQLRSALLHDIAALAPDWRGAQEMQGPDRAVVEIAARLAEEATKRLDKTPERDALAFLEMFDIAPPRPSAAKGVSVFALKENKTAPVLARARTGIEIETLAGEPAQFETVEDLRIQPAQIGLLATLDPAADRLELAPGQVTSLEPDLTLRPDYQLATSVGPEATLISIDPPVGILPDDLLRVTLTSDGDPVFVEVAEFSEDGLATLKAPVGGAGLSRDQVEKIECMTRLDAFKMPNRQEHGLYIGDKDVLNVKEPAEFTLRFEPQSIPEILSPNAVEFEIWGTKEGPGIPEETPGWHRLVPLVGAGADLRLYKSWIGPVDELELGEKKSRWIRIRPQEDITPDAGGGHPLTAEDQQLEQVKIGVETKEPKDNTGDTVSQVAYNGTPLPLTTSFLPFGPEPQRFDTFALAAPEAFTKPGAKTTLNFSLMDATLAAMTASLRLDSDRHVYGIGRNGRLQVMDLTGDRTLWREAGGPPEEDGSDVTLALEAAAGLVAYGWTKAPAFAVKARDVLIAKADGGGLVSAQVDVTRSAQASADTSVSVVAWEPLPDFPEGVLQDAEHPTLAVVPVLGPDNAHFNGFLLAASSGGMHRITVGNNRRATTANWSRVTDASGDPVLPPGPILTFVDGSVDRMSAPFLQDGGFVAVDETGALWVLRIRLNGLSPSWTQLADNSANPIRLDPGARPAALRMQRGGNDRLLVAGLPLGGPDVQLWEFVYGGGFGFANDLGTGPAIDASAALRLVRGLSGPGEALPHLLAYQTRPGVGSVIEWAPETGQVSSHEPAQDMTLADPPEMTSAGIFPPDDKDDRALVVFGAEDQALVQLRINPSALLNQQADWIPVPQTALPDAGGYDLILVERVPAGQTAREIEEVSVFDSTQAADDVIQLDAGTTDWQKPVRVFRAKSATETADFDPTLGPGDAGFGTLKGPVGSTSAIPDGRLLVIQPTNDPDEYGILAVASTASGNELTVTEPDDLVTLMNGHDKAEWQEIDMVGGADAGTSDRFIGTLVRIGPVPAEPDYLSLFETPGTAVATEVLSSPGQNRNVILMGWGGTLPAVGVLVKIVANEASAELLKVKSLSSNFSAPELSWEYFNGEGWKLLDKGFSDTTADFSRSGFVSFTVPLDLKQTEIGGQEDFWIRARLVSGDYGKPVYKVITTPTEQRVEIDTSDLRPPEVAGVTAQFKLDPKHLPELVVARNNLRDLDQSSANRLAGANFAMFEGAFAVPLGTGGGRAIMLGMTRPLEPGSASLFVQVRDQDREAKLILETLGPANEWAPVPLSEEDPTKGLFRTGLLRFTVTERLAQVLMFGEALHWLRMRVAGLADWAPQITGIWLNGVRIVQAETVRQELLGSSAGEPNLELALLKRPVLANSLELRMRERLSDEEAAALNTEARDAEQEPVKENVPNLPGKWILWNQVNSLQDQAGDARVYLLNPDGRLRFGDDQNGRIVPAGRDNIRAFTYLSGGQRVETAAFADAGLRGSVEGVEMVLAPAPIAGGTHPPTSTELVARMPEVLRHAGHGLSLVDLEALARDADSEIVQARAFAPDVPGGPVRLIVLARGANRKPEYSLARRDNLRRVLHAKMSDAYGSACLEVRKAAFVDVKVAVNLVARPGALAALETDAGAHLRTFLHAALGGPDGNGWPPGRALWPTDIRRALSQLETLDRVVSVEIVMPGGRSLGDVRPHEVFTTASVRDVTILVDGEAET
jgi:hypothetical protein